MSHGPDRETRTKRRAWARLAAQKRRAGLLRGRVVIASLICFALLWGIVFAQMATGNDPVLSAKSKTVATRPIGERRRNSKRPRPAKSTRDAAVQEKEAPPRTNRRGSGKRPRQAKPKRRKRSGEIEAAEIAEIEAAEAEPLVTSQS